MDIKTAEQFSRIFRAVAEPNRHRIIALLRRQGELSVGDIAKQLELTQPTISQHLRILKDAGALRSRKEGQHAYYRVLSARICDALEEFVKIYKEEQSK